LPIVAVSLRSDGHVELHLVVCIVWLSLPHVLLDSRSPDHHSSESPVECICRRDQTDIDRSRLPDSVLCQHVFQLVDSLGELHSPVIDVIHQSEREIPCDSSRSHVVRVHSCTRDTLRELEQLLTLLEHPEEWSHGSDIKGVSGDAHDVV
ncbi:hypothetical protein PMAYCL1PPCAC_02197, partial [Pristionchus mayeri]